MARLFVVLMLVSVVAYADETELPPIEVEACFYTPSDDSMGSVIESLQVKWDASDMKESIGMIFPATLDGVCPVWSMPVFEDTVDIDFQCSQTFLDALSVVSIVLALTATIISLRLALS